MSTLSLCINPEGHDYVVLKDGWFKPFPPDAPEHQISITGTAYDHSRVFSTLYCRRCGRTEEVLQRGKS